MLCLLVSRSDRQNGCNLRQAREKQKNVKRIINEEGKDEYLWYRIPVLGTWYFARFLALLYVRRRAQRSTVKHGKATHRRAGHGTAQHRTALRFAKLS